MNSELLWNLIGNAVRAAYTVDEHALQKFSAMGLGHQTIETLMNLSMVECMRLVSDQNAVNRILAISVNEEEVRRQLQLLQLRTKADQLCIDFIRRGASTNLMHRLFSLPKTRVTEWRTVLGISPNPGMPQLPEAVRQRQIYIDWTEAHPKLSERDAYWKLACAHPDIELRVIEQIVRRWSRDAIEFSRS